MGLAVGRELLAMDLTAHQTVQYLSEPLAHLAVSTVPEIVEELLRRTVEAERTGCQLARSGLVSADLDGLLSYRLPVKPVTG
jgi:hypothetical protein